MTPGPRNTWERGVNCKGIKAGRDSGKGGGGAGGEEDWISAGWSGLIAFKYAVFLRTSNNVAKPDLVLYLHSRKHMQSDYSHLVFSR